MNRVVADYLHGLRVSDAWLAECARVWAREAHLRALASRIRRAFEVCR